MGRCLRTRLAASAPRTPCCATWPAPRCGWWAGSWPPALDGPLDVPARTRCGVRARGSRTGSGTWGDTTMAPRRPIGMARRGPWPRCWPVQGHGFDHLWEVQRRFVRVDGTGDRLEIGLDRYRRPDGSSSCCFGGLGPARSEPASLETAIGGTTEFATAWDGDRLSARPGPSPTSQNALIATVVVDPAYQGLGIGERMTPDPGPRPGAVLARGRPRARRVVPELVGSCPTRTRCPGPAGVADRGCGVAFGMTRLRSLAVILAVVVALAACTPAAPSDGPGATVAEAIRLAGAKDIDGLRGLACAGQEDAVREILGCPTPSGASSPCRTWTRWWMPSASTSRRRGGRAVVEGDVAHVPVTGSVKVTFDADRPQRSTNRPASGAPRRRRRQGVRTALADGPSRSDQDGSQRWRRLASPKSPTRSGPAGRPSCGAEPPDPDSRREPAVTRPPQPASE